MRKKNYKSIVNKTTFIIFLIIVLAVAYVYFYIIKVNAKAEEDKRVIKAVTSIVQLPEDEVPTVATITDSTKLARQPFFKHAKNGDKVLIYIKIQKAILYRPSTKKIIEVAPVMSLDPTQIPTTK